MAPRFMRAAISTVPERYVIDETGDQEYKLPHSMCEVLS